jgi:hypothetical protein
MRLSIIETLREAFKCPKAKLAKRRTVIETKQAAALVLTTSEEDFLDREGNIVDEQRVLNALEGGAIIQDVIKKFGGPLAVAFLLGRGT